MDLARAGQAQIAELGGDTCVLASPPAPSEFMATQIPGAYSLLVDGRNITDMPLRGKLGAIGPVCATIHALIRIPRESAMRHFNEPGKLFHVYAWGHNP